MKTTLEKVAVMQAFERGEKIEVTYIGKNEWVAMESDMPAWNWETLDYRIAPIPESKAEQEEKAEEGKQVTYGGESCEFYEERRRTGKLIDQSPKEDSCRSEESKAFEEFVRNKMPTFSEEIVARAGWDAGAAWAKNALIGINLSPTEKPSPSPKTKRVPLTKSHFDGQAVIWVKSDAEFEEEEAPVGAITYAGMTIKGKWLPYSNLQELGLLYSFDRKTWHPFFVEVADE